MIEYFLDMVGGRGSNSNSLQLAKYWSKTSVCIIFVLNCRNTQYLYSGSNYNLFQINDKLRCLFCDDVGELLRK